MTILKNPITQWRLLALAVAIVVIVVAPFVILGDANRNSDEAWIHVAHTHEVEARVHQLASDARNLQAAALAMASGFDSELIQQRIAQSQAGLVAGIREMQYLTRDNPEQQVRLGALQSLMALRAERIERILQQGAAADRDDVDALVQRYPIHELVEEIISEEQALLAARQERAERVGRRAQIVTWSSMVVQLLLLSLLLFLVMRQIASRLHAERDALRASLRATAVLDTVREPIVLVDGGLQVVMHNAAFAELYGVEGDIRGQPLAETGDGIWRDEGMLRRLRDVLARERELWDHEQQQRTADDVERTMLINARPMPLPDSDDRVALVTVSDISAQKASERQIRNLNHQLEGKVEQISDVNRELEAFSYSVSHDLRAPLRHIAGFSEKLGRHLGERSDDRTRHYLGVIGSSAQRMSSLIDDLLVYSRLGRSAIRLQMVDLQSMVAETRSLLDANVHNDHPGHHVEWSIDPLPVVVGDENMLRQLWLNLMGNAVKYSRGSEPARIEIHYEQADDGGHRFTVRDNGAGFDMKYAGKLFGVFQRLHSPSEFPGTGIGLASVRRVLARHGGRIWAESEPGKGATFHFTLPPAGDITPTPGS